MYEDPTSLRRGRCNTNRLPGKENGTEQNGIKFKPLGFVSTWWQAIGPNEVCKAE